MAPATPCALPRCTCEVQMSQAVVRDGQSFFSEACATEIPTTSFFMAADAASVPVRIEVWVGWFQPPVVRAGLSSIVSPDTVTTMVRVPSRIGYTG